MNKALIPLLLIPNLALADDAAVLACRALLDAPSRLACYDAMPVAGRAAPAAAAPAAAGFGLRPAVQPRKDAGPDAIRSHVAGTLDGWSPGKRIVLANGQTWRVTDGEAVLPMLESPKVEVTRGLLGAYFLQVEGHTSAARVTRER